MWLLHALDFGGIKVMSRHAPHHVRKSSVWALARRPRECSFHLWIHLLHDLEQSNLTPFTLLLSL